MARELKRERESEKIRDNCCVHFYNTWNISPEEAIKWSENLIVRLVIWHTPWLVRFELAREPGSFNHTNRPTRRTNLINSKNILLDQILLSKLFVSCFSKCNRGLDDLKKKVTMRKWKRFWNHPILEVKNRKQKTLSSSAQKSLLHWWKWKQSRFEMSSSGKKDIFYYWIEKWVIKTLKQ